MKIITLISMFAMLLFLSGTVSSFTEKAPYKTHNSVTLIDSVVGSNTVRIMKIQANMVVDTAEELLLLVDRAKAKGANTVLYGDSKLNRFGIGQNPGNRWLTETQKFVDGVREREMDLLFMSITMGFCGSVISDDVNLTTGYPIKDQPLRLTNGELRPVSTASIPNGGFENYSGNVPDGWKFQDAAGTRTFVDTAVKRSGNASFRADAKGGAMSRIITSFNVKPFHQYTLRFWIKAENLSAQNVLAIVRDENNKERNLTNLRLSTPKADGSRTYFNRPNNLTLEWTEMRIAFNSLNATEVNLGLSMFGGTSGKLWWDDVSLLDTPALNWLNRADLPVTVKRQNGTALSIGTDVQNIVDPKLGQSGFAGKYDTHHSVPKIRPGNESRIQEDEVVTISGYHALPTANGQISCSWNNPEVYARMRMIHERMETTFKPDGYLLNYSEIRTGGWEPSDLQFGTSGAALAASIEQAYKDLEAVAPNAKFYFWNDMVDPNHNAKADYYQINNTLAESWNTLDPNKVVIATWWEGQKITDKGPASLKFFSDRGFEQVLGAYYDEDVANNFNRWQTAAQGVSGIVGNMYATWREDYSKIEPYGDLWWTTSEDETEDEVLVDSLSVTTSITEVRPGNTYALDIDYEASEERDIVGYFQQNRSPWAGYGYTKMTVPEGTGTRTISVRIDEATPTAIEGYKWVVFITPKNSTWKERLYLEKIDPVSCVAESNTPDETETDGNDTLEEEVKEENDFIKELIAYPNPIKGEVLNLGFAEKPTKIAIRIYDYDGKLIKVQNARESTDVAIEVGALNQGTYLVHVYYDDTFKVIKVLVE